LRPVQARPQFCGGGGKAAWVWSLRVTSPNEPLQLRDITVDRKQQRVLAGVSLAVIRGEVTIVVGPHRSGKTSLVEAVIEALPRSDGEVRVGARVVQGLRELRALFCYQAAEAEPPLEVRVETQLALSRPVEGTDTRWAVECERRLGLMPLRERRLGSLTRPQRQRVLLFGSLMSSRPFWLLDDPLGPFDPLERAELTPLLRHAAQRGAGLLLTASELLGAEPLADHLVLLDAGHVVAHGTPGLLRAQAGLPDVATLDQVCTALLRAAPHASPSAAAERVA
jgi:ABC-2 type transport system ATP-binding protein